MVNVSLSTAYLLGKTKSWDELLLKARLLGFKELELSVEVPAEWIRGVVSSVQKGEVSIPSVHNYCPALKKLPPSRTIYSGYLLTSEDADERRLAEKFTCETIELAAALGAKIVVMHAGEIGAIPTGRELFGFVRKHGRDSKAYESNFESIKKTRKENFSRHFDLLLKGLEKILLFADKNKIKIGLENRFFLDEIPNIDETEQIFEIFPDGPLGYWHDTGHAEIFVRNGWVKSHREYLERLGSKLIGVHLHDLKGLADHFAPGSGDFDFSVLKPFMGKEILRVVEAHSQSSDEEVSNSINYLRKEGLIT